MPFDGTSIDQDSRLLLLQKVKQILLEEGWIRQTLQSPRGYCLIGAARATNMDYDNFAQDLGFYRREEIVYWNDCKSRRKGQVIARLDAAIERRRAALLAELVG